MSDINITLDASAAIIQANNLKTALDKVELAARKVDSAGKKIIFRGDIKITMSALKKARNQIQAMAKTLKPIIISAKVETKKDSLAKAGQADRSKWLDFSDEDLKKKKYLQKQKDAMYDKSHQEKMRDIDELERKMSKNRKRAGVLGTAEVTTDPQLWDSLERIDKKKPAGGYADDLFQRIEQGSIKAEKAMTPLTDQTKMYRGELRHLTDSYEKGNISTETYKKRIHELGKNFEGVEKKLKTVGKSGSIMHSTFGKITMTLTAIAASLFILQKLQQYMVALARIGSEYVKTLAMISAETGRTAQGSEYLASTFKEMTKNSAIGLNEMYDAYKELRREGLDTNSAMEKTLITAKMARDGNLKLADAARIAANDVHGVADQYLRYNDAMSKTATDAWSILKRDVTDIIAEFYKKEEPMFVDWIKTLKSFTTGILPGLLMGMEAFFLVLHGVITVLKPFALLLEEIGKAARAMPSLSSLFDLGKQIEAPLEQQLKAAEELFAQSAGKIAATSAENVVKSASLGGEFELAVNPVKEFKNSEEELRKAAEGTNVKLAAQAKAVLALRRALDGLKDTHLSLVEILKLNQQIYTKLGITTKYLADEETRGIKKNNAQLLKAGTAFYAYKVQKFDLYTKEQKEVKALMETHKQMFAITGQVAAEYYENRVKQIDHEIWLMSLVNKNLDIEFLRRSKLKKLNDEFNAPKRKAHEEIFTDTGIITDYMKRERQIDAGEKAMARTRSDPKNAMAYNLALQNELIKIEEDTVSKTLELETSKFEKIGIITNDYIDAQTKMFALMKRRLVEVYKVGGDEAEAQMSRMRDEFNLTLLAGIKFGDSMEGIWAGIGRVAIQTRMISVAERVSDAWVSGAASVGQAWKGLFFDVMEMNFDNLEDSITSVLKSIQKMFIDILYQQLMYGHSGLITGITGSLNKLMGKDTAATEAVQQDVLTASLSAQTASVSTLTASYYALAAAKAAAGMGGFAGTTWSGQNATGAGTSTIRGGGGGGYGFAEGGWITEPILGRGMRTGRGYTLGEAGPELVTPAGKVAGGGGAPSVKINIENKSGQPIEMKTQGTQVNGQDIIVSAVIDAYRRDKGGLRTMMGGR